LTVPDQTKVCRSSNVCLPVTDWRYRNEICYRANLCSGRRIETSCLTTHDGQEQITERAVGQWWIPRSGKHHRGGCHRVQDPPKRGSRWWVSLGQVSDVLSGLLNFRGPKTIPGNPEYIWCRCRWVTVAWRFDFDEHLDVRFPRRGRTESYLNTVPGIHFRKYDLMFRTHLFCLGAVRGKFLLLKTSTFRRYWSSAFCRRSGTAIFRFNCRVDNISFFFGWFSEKLFLNEKKKIRNWKSQIFFFFRFFFLKQFWHQ
jgi:hypothetical protein